jgi:hypothetical protein
MLNRHQADDRIDVAGITAQSLAEEMNAVIAIAGD